TVTGAEVGRTTETLERVGAETAALKARDHRPIALAKGFPGGIAEIAGLTQTIGQWVVRQQRRARQRPAAVGHVVACFEVNRVEGHAAPAPDRGGAAEASLAVSIRRAVHPLIGDRAG